MSPLLTVNDAKYQHKNSVKTLGLSFEQFSIVKKVFKKAIIDNIRKL